MLKELTVNGAEQSQTQTKGLTSNHLKIIAIAAMFFDHFVAMFVNHNTEIGMILRVIGRVVAPIICFMIAEGFHKTSNVNRYILRLFIFALISHLPYNLAFGLTFFQATSVMWGLALGLLALKVVKMESVHIVFKLGVVAMCCLLSITANWNYISVLWIVGFGVFYGDLKKQIIAFCVVAVIAHIVPTFMNFGFTHEGYPHWYQFGVFLAIPLLWMYNGQRGKDVLRMGKYGFYIFYPAHLIFLYLLSILTPLKDILWGII